MNARGDITDTLESNGEAPQPDACLTELRAECKEAWKKVKESQQHLEETRQPPCSALSASEPSLLAAILREKERRLRAEIEVARELEPQTLPQNAQVLDAALFEDVEREVGHLRETLSLVESQRQELQASIQQELHNEQQLLAVHAKLQENCEGLDGEGPPEDAVETVAQELEVKVNQARQTERVVMKKMAAFVAKHFPRPEPAQVAEVSKGLRSKKQHNQETLPLKDILLELMTKCVESPNDPYMELTDKHWPAYIELMLRCNVILQHPDDDRRVKLVPFHL
ncbi:hypothetical protein ACOMHN_028191 [Nucella lapillus]